MSDIKRILGRDITRAEFEQMKQAMAGEAGQQMAQMMEAMETAFGGGDGGEVKTVELDVPLPADVAEADVRAALERVRYGYAEPWFDKLRVELDLFWIPNAETLQVAAEWPGGVSPVQEPSFDARKLVYSCELPGSGDEEAAPAPFAATVRLSTAASVKTVTLTPADVGRTRDGWTLVSFDANGVSLRAPAGTDDAIIAGFDARGRRLDWSGTGTEVVHSSGKLLWELEWDDLSEDKMSVVRTASFQGEAVEVRIAVPSRRIEQSLPVTIVPVPRTGEGPPEGVRFSRGREPRFAGFTERQVREQTVVRFSRNTAMMEKGQPTVVLQLPAAENSAYATVEFGDFRLSGAKGDLSGFETVDGGRDHAAHAEERRFTDSEGDMAFPGLRRIRGSATVRYPLRVQVVRGRKGRAGPVEIDVDGNTAGVTYDPEKVPGLDASTASFLPDDLERVVARHESGLYLKRLPFQGMRSDERGMRLEFRFWGTPHEVEVRIPSDYVEFTVPIDLPVE